MLQPQWRVTHAAVSVSTLVMLPKTEPQEQAHAHKTPLANLTPLPHVTGQNSCFFSQNVLIVFATANN